MEKATCFTLQGKDKEYNVVAGEHLAIIYYPPYEQDDSDDRLIYQISPIISIYGSRYIAPICLADGLSNKSDIESDIKWILTHDDAQSTEEYWMCCSSDKYKDITVGRIVSQDPNVIYISYNITGSKDSSVISVYCLIFVQDVDWRKFKDIHTTEVKILSASLVNNRDYHQMQDNDMKLIHIHE